MRITILALSALALTVSAGASAKDLVIKYDDLNLASAKGQQALERRIDNAARTYCGADSRQTGTRIMSAATHECVKSARAAAHEQMAVLVQRETALKGG